ncbi:hypothetical protein [Lentzea guizhouensis]|uniref:hypothetical protein n=1 Tax=Lentzea guizhouensis TaxID=1586287 RepID=UPI001F2FFEFC|nr:hypothetical protein [Lentzea guizhouensis]
MGRLAGPLGAVVLDWQCDEEVLGLELGPVATSMSAAHATPSDDTPALRAFWLSLRGDGAELAEQVLGEVAHGGGAMPDLVFAGLALLHTSTGYASVLLELAPRLRLRLAGAEDDWLVALEAWAHRCNGDHAEVSRLVRELTARTSPARGCAALGAAAFVASAVDGGAPVRRGSCCGGWVMRARCRRRGCAPRCCTTAAACTWSSARRGRRSPTRPSAASGWRCGGRTTWRSRRGGWSRGRRRPGSAGRPCGNRRAGPVPRGEG